MASNSPTRVAVRLARRAAVAAAAVAAAAVVTTAAPAAAQVTVPTVPGSGTTTTTRPPATTSTTAPPTTTTANTGTTAPEAPDVPTVTAPPAPFDDPAVTAPSATTPSPATTAPRRVARPVTRPAAALSAAAVTGSYGIGLAAVLGFALIVSAFATHARPGGTPMSDSRRNRLALGVACLAVAAVIGLIGYLKLSLEPNVNRQIPYLASAGMALVLLSAAGGALIVGEQLRADDRRIEELENAVRTLADALAPTIEAPPRHRVDGTGRDALE